METRRTDLTTSIGLLILRLGVGGYMLSHGVGKLRMLAVGEFAKFGDPIGLGSEISLVLLTMAEFLCALLVIVGLFTRFAAAPIVVAMGVAAFVAHHGDPWSMETAALAYFAGESETWFSKEPALLFLFPFLALMFTGAGALSLDRWLPSLRLHAGPFRSMKRTTICLIALVMMVPRGPHAEDTVTGLDTHRILELTGGKGQFDEKEGVFKVTEPRTDLSVVVGDVRVTPPLGLTSWAAFKPAGEETMVMGDLVVLEAQVSSVMDTALETGLDVTALHNHFLGDTPKVMFMHVGGTGDQEALAKAVGAVFARIRDTAEAGGPLTKAKIDPAKTTLDPKRIEAILGVAGKLDAGVYKVVVGREAKMHGHPIGGSMGVNTWAAFAGSDDEAVVAGDFAMRPDEVPRVLRALRAASIHVVALHNHMTEESPRTFFLHYWGVGSTDRLAKGLRAALDLTSDRPGP